MKTLLMMAAAIALTACAHKEKIVSVAKDNAKPIFENCMKEYKKTMSDSDARKACAEKLKQGYESATKN